MPSVIVYSYLLPSDNNSTHKVQKYFSLPLLLPDGDGNSLASWTGVCPSKGNLSLHFLLLPFHRVMIQLLTCWAGSTTPRSKSFCRPYSDFKRLTNDLLSGTLLKTIQRLWKTYRWSAFWSTSEGHAVTLKDLPIICAFWSTLCALILLYKSSSTKGKLGIVLEKITWTHPIHRVPEIARVIIHNAKSFNQKDSGGNRCIYFKVLWAFSQTSCISHVASVVY